MSYTCPEHSTCADYRPERIRCCFMYGSCKTRKDIETAREHLRLEEKIHYLLRLSGRGNEVDYKTKIDMRIR